MEANTLLAAAGVATNMDPIPTIITNNAITEHNADVNLLAGTNTSISNVDGHSPMMAMNLTTNTKGPQEICSVREQTEHFGQPQTKDGNIDLSLPITSTYLRRMKALGLPYRYGNLYGQHNTLFHVSKIGILT